MIKIFCHTNLDLRDEEWPTELPAVPQVGQRIASKRFDSIRHFYEWYAPIVGSSVSSFI
jgi:hypothetical protein